MIRSLRWRVQLWHAVILGLVIAVFGTAFYTQLRRATLHEIDAELLSGARMLEGSLRSMPPRAGNFVFPPFPPGPIDDRSRPPRGRARPPMDGSAEPPLPLRPPREFMDNSLRLPPSRMRGPDDEPDYYAIFADDGSLLRSNPSGINVQWSNIYRAVEYRIIGTQREVLLRGPNSTLIVVGRDIRHHLDRLTEWLVQLALSAIAVLCLGLVGGWWLAGRAILPIRTISETAGKISAANLSQRIETSALDKELHELATILNSMLMRLEESFRQQAQFTADASHELRTPVAVLLSHCELALSRPRTPDEYEQTLQTCHKAAERMRALIEGLLVLSRADAGALHLNIQSLDLHALAVEVVAMCEPLAGQRSVTLVHEGGPARCHGDEARIVQVISNLVSNGIHYNRTGGKVTVTTSTQGDWAVLQVRDTGCGMAPESLAQIFDRFYRIDEARSRLTGGSGLGLAICKSIVDAHGGRLTVESQLDIGSTFELRLPTSLWAAFKRSK